MELKITVTRDEGTPEVGVLRFEGTLETDSIDRIDKAFDEVTANGHVHVVADMADLDSISSSSVGKLMECRRRVHEKSGDLVLAGLSIAIREALVAMEANKIFRFYPDLRSAVNAYNWEYHGRTENLSIRFPARLQFVPSIRRLVSRITRQKGYGKKDSFRIETIIDEICNNAVEHGNQDDARGVELTFSIDSQKIEIKVVNVSDPEKVEALKEVSRSLNSPSTAAEDTRGRGLTLVKMLSNDFRIDCSNGGTCVNVTKLREE
ncbi:MAG: STAS domain-containing protein [Chitinivibrionales bacterium]|nr:STAS domain-containing protein [Chitinivibrionales bacterium]MBD3358093.1 STAS domain-containing protein [Chitinivibrionales bacterium]